jgi:hypothetical protein
MRAAPSLLVIAALGALVACGPSGDDTPGECADSILAGDLVVSEVFADYDAPDGGSGADDGKEWFEIYNNADRPIDLTGLTITHARIDGGMAKTHVVGSVTLASDEYLVLGNTLPDLVPGFVDYGYAEALGDLYNTGGGRITLSCGASEIDHADYDMVDAGVSRQFDGGGRPDYTANDELANWCAATEDGGDEFDPGNFGTPGSPNEDCAIVIAGQCNDQGTMRDTIPPAVGDLVLTEVMPSPELASDDTAEWFEVLATRAVDLNDLILDRADDSAGGDPVTSEDCIHLAAGSYAVFARSADTTMNGGLGAVAGEFDFTLVGGSVASPGDVQLLYGTTVLDSFTWTRSTNGEALQVDPDSANATDNDLEANWCDATMTYGAGDLGTPGAGNDECPVVVGPGQCIDEGSGLPRDVVTPTAGQIEITEWMPNPALVSDANGEWLEVHTLAAFDLNGLQIGDATLATTSVVTAATCVPVAADTYLLFAQTSDALTNGMLPTVDGVFPSGVDLTNSGGTVQVGIDGAALDTETYGTAASGVAIQSDTDGTVCNVPNGSGQTPQYNGTDYGTPGAALAVECP